MPMKTVILCGGKGTRAYPYTIDVPKPLLEVGERPVLQHVLEIYARQGYTDFVLAAGYRADMIEQFASGLPDAWSVEVVDTGEDANTALRILRCRDRLGDTFFANYSDGLGDVDLGALAAFHAAHDGAASLTCVPLPSQYGTLELEQQSRIVRFREKPRLPDHLINAGYFVFDQAAFETWPGDDLERDVLPALAAAKTLHAFRHDGFWKSMDTYKDALDLTALCADGDGPWSGANRDVVAPTT